MKGDSNSWVDRCGQPRKAVQLRLDTFSILNCFAYRINFCFCACESLIGDIFPDRKLSSRGFFSNFQVGQI